MTDLKKLMAEAQTDEPWSVVWYGDEHLPAIAIHRTAEDRICFMPTIQHPADGVQFEANAALIVAAVNAVPELLVLREEVVRLREALKPFAEARLESWGQRTQGVGDYLTRVWIGTAPNVAFYEARAALNQESGQ